MFCVSALAADIGAKGAHDTCLNVGVLLHLRVSCRFASCSYVKRVAYKYRLLSRSSGLRVRSCTADAMRHVCLLRPLRYEHDKAVQDALETTAPSQLLRQEAKS